MPGIRLTSDKMAEGIARLGTSALGVRAVQAPSGDYIADFTVLFAAARNAERYEDMRAWLHCDEKLYLIPDDTGSDRLAFQFARGLRKVANPWLDEADRLRGLGEAATLLLAATHRLRSRFTNFLISSGLCAPCGDALNEALENGFLAHHERGVVVTATSCERPLFYPEGTLGRASAPGRSGSKHKASKNSFASESVESSNILRCSRSRYRVRCLSAFGIF